MAKKLWGGRFSKSTDPFVEQFSSSIGVDVVLALCDLIGSFIHVTVLKHARLISAAEYGKLSKGILVLMKQVEQEKFQVSAASEDIHSDVQNKLEKKIGNVAKKLHTARSRNDQVVFDTKLYCIYKARQLYHFGRGLQATLKKSAKRYKNITLPGYTHLQHAQPISLQAYFLAYATMLERDTQRIQAAGERITLSQGAGALAGTNISAACYQKAFREALKKLGLTGLSLSVPNNSLEVVSDRDFVVEFLSALAILGMHISRLSEDLILWSTSEFGFIELDDAYCTGSSLMPQKKNPDVLELIRGHAGTLYGNLMAVLTTMKGLPLAYNRDMQLDKAPLFSSIAVCRDSLRLLTRIVDTLQVNRTAIERQLQDESLYATDIAHYLVEKGVAFKDAHDILGRLIQYSAQQGIPFVALSNSQLKRFSMRLNQRTIAKLINPKQALASKKSVRSARR